MSANKACTKSFGLLGSPWMRGGIGFYSLFTVLFFLKTLSIKLLQLLLVH